MKSACLFALTLFASSPVLADAPKRDPKIVKLATAASKCKFVDDYFVDGCRAFNVWKDNEALFEGGKGNDTLLSMYGDANVKIRVLASEKYFTDPGTYFASQERATELVAAAKKETHNLVARQLAQAIVKTDVDKLGLSADVIALAKHPVPELRASLAGMLVQNPTATALKVVEILIEDTDRNVRDSAIGALSGGGVTKPTDPVCKLLRKQIARTDETGDRALWSGSTSKCPGVKALALAEVDKRTADPSKITNTQAVHYTLTLSFVCDDFGIAEHGKKAYAVATRLTSAKASKDVRHYAVSNLGSCGRASAVPALRQLMSDADPSVAAEAKRELAHREK